MFDLYGRKFDPTKKNGTVEFEADETLIHRGFTNREAAERYAGRQRQFGAATDLRIEEVNETV